MRFKNTPAGRWAAKAFIISKGLFATFAHVIRRQKISLIDYANSIKD